MILPEVLFLLFLFISWIITSIWYSACHLTQLLLDDCMAIKIIEAGCERTSEKVLILIHGADTVKLYRKGELEPLLSEASGEKKES